MRAKLGELMMNPLDFVNVMSAMMTIVLAALLLKMIWKLDASYLAGKKVRKNRRRQYFGM